MTESHEDMENQDEQNDELQEWNNKEKDYATDQAAEEKPSKDEYMIAKWMKKNVKTKKTKFLSHNVEYFTSNKAIDALMKSKFAQGDGALLQTREQAIEFLDIMLEHKFFHRAKKVPVTVEELRGATGKQKKERDDKKDEKSRKEKDTDKKDTEAEAEASGANGVDDACQGALEKKEKRKRKIRLDMHAQQVFVDGSEAYVWIYDPIPIHYWIYGFVLLLGAIGICLFPLWPPMLRKGVYYLSIAAAGFLVFILALTIVRLIVFTIVWALTGGKLHFWIFPNLTEDVGFFASFWPLYESKYVQKAIKNKSEKNNQTKSKKKESNKHSDAEGDAAGDAVTLEPAKIEEIKEHDADMELRRRNIGEGPSNMGQKNTAGEEDEEDSHSGGDNSEAPAESDAKGSRTPSESESEISGKDYEIISTSEVQNVN